MQVGLVCPVLVAAWLQKQKRMDRRFLHWQDGLVDRDRAVFADQLIQVVGMSWDGRGAYQEGMRQKDDETAD